MIEQGIKHDQRKPRISLFPLRALWEMAKVMTFGAKKYGSFNWKGGLRYTRLADAALRHVVQFIEGEDLDKETGISHLAHAGCCIAMLLEMTMDRKDMDDRHGMNNSLPWEGGNEV